MTRKYIKPVRIVLIIVLTTLMTVFVTYSAMAKESQTHFNDVPSTHTAYKAITWCANQNIIAGYNDSTFHPNDIVSGKSFHTMLKRAFDINPGHDINNQKVTRYEAAQAITDITNLNKTTADTYDQLEASKKISDFNDIPKEYQKAVSNVYALNIMNGLSDGEFHGENNITRAQAAIIIYRTAHISDEVAMIANPTLTNGKEITEKNVKQLITELKQAYPSNTDFPGYSKLDKTENAGNNSIRNIIESYTVTGTKDDKCSTDTGCGGWAAFVEDYIFGQNAKFHKTTLDKIHPGDLMLKLDSTNKLTHVQVYVSPINGYKLNQMLRITNANNGIGEPTKAGTTAYKINWYNANTLNSKFDIYTAYPE